MSSKINQIELEVQAKLNQISFEIRVHKLDTQAEIDQFDKVIHGVKNTLSEVSLGHYACKREIKEITSEISLMGKLPSFKGPASKSGEAVDEQLHREADSSDNNVAKLQRSVLHIEH